MLKQIRNACFTIGLGLYPLIIYIGLKRFSPRLISLFMIVCLIGSMLVPNRFAYNTRFLLPTIGIGALCLLSAFLNESQFMLYSPVLISASFFFTFGYSLFFPPSTVEIFARMSTTYLSQNEIDYCRIVTLIWVIFFAVNGTLAGLTACCMMLELWSLYNGFIAYMAMGLLFAAELCYRYWRFRRYVGLPTDFLFKKLFPPRE